MSEKVEYERINDTDLDEDESRLVSESQAEQSGLLDGDRESGPLVEKGDVERDVGNAGRSGRRRLLFGIALVILCLLVSSAGAYASPIRKYFTGVSSDANVAPRDDEYVLDSRWDFDAAPTRREYRWTISDVELNPDGVFRPMMVINGKFPGPLIECNEGDTINVLVDNQAINATTIHWHGLFQNTTNFMDGTVGVTQCPIAPGKKFTYEFKVKGQSGTYWYHGHHGLQAADGLFGPLIIHSREEKASRNSDYDTDRIVMVQDHYHDLSGSLLPHYLEPDRENEEPVPDGALINGRNIRKCDDLPHRKCDNSTSSITSFRLETGKKHRLRFINVGTFAEFQITLDGHEFAVTEVDGTDVLPVHYHRLNISPAQRYSIVISDKDVGPGAYWMRAKMVTKCFATTNEYMDPEVRAIIHYPDAHTDHSKLSLPRSKDWSDAIEVECRDMNVTELVPVHAVAAPQTADAFFNIHSNFEIGDWRLSRGFFNSTSWRPQVESPLLIRTLDGLSEGNTSYANAHGTVAGVNDRAYDTKRELVVQTTGIQTIDLVIQNFDDGNHPMHLHGYKFFVLAHGDGYFNAEKTYPSLNLTNPLRRDTATVEPYGWLLIRVIADNPGIWALHCHVAWHSEAGLLMNFVIRTEILRGWSVPSESRQLCDAANLESGAAPKDEIWFGNTGSR